MLGFCCCCASAGTLAVIAAMTAVSRPSQIVLNGLTMCLLGFGRARSADDLGPYGQVDAKIVWPLSVQLHLNAPGRRRKPLSILTASPGGSLTEWCPTLRAVVVE